MDVIETQKCPICCKDKTQDGYYPSTWKATLPEFMMGCKECQKISSRAQYHKHKRPYLAKMDGYIYVMANAAWPGWFKVGMTNSDTVDSRIKCFQISSPFRDYICAYSIEVKNALRAEQAIHKKLATKYEMNYEWVNAPLDEVIKVITASTSKIEVKDER